MFWEAFDLRKEVKEHWTLHPATLTFTACCLGLTSVPHMPPHQIGSMRRGQAAYLSHHLAFFLLPGLIVHVSPVTSRSVRFLVVFSGNRIVRAKFFPERDVRQGAAGVHEVLEHVPQGETFLATAFTDEVAQWETQRSALMLYEAHQHKSDDVCNILDVSASNLRVLLHRARQKIFLMVETFQETGEC